MGGSSRCIVLISQKHPHHPPIVIHKSKEAGGGGSRLQFITPSVPIHLNITSITRTYNSSQPMFSVYCSGEGRALPSGGKRRERERENTFFSYQLNFVKHFSLSASVQLGSLCKRRKTDGLRPYRVSLPHILLSDFKHICPIPCYNLDKASLAWKPDLLPLINAVCFAHKTLLFSKLNFRFADSTDKFHVVHVF